MLRRYPIVVVTLFVALTCVGCSFESVQPVSSGSEAQGSSIVTESEEPIIREPAYQPVISEPVDLKGDEEGEYVFTLNAGEDIEDLVLSEPGTTYNPRLAHCAMILADAVNHEGVINEDLELMGFETEGEGFLEHTEDDLITEHAIVRKRLDDGSYLIIVVIAGSSGEDWVTALSVNTLGMMFGESNTDEYDHYGFASEADTLYEELQTVLPDDALGVTYLITGHSQGAAVGNFLAKKLVDGGVDNTSIYNYNFACPNLATHNDVEDFNPDGKYDCIFNICNKVDVITYVPGQRAAFFDNWGKYGVTFWFDSELQDLISNHLYEAYLDELVKERPISDYNPCVYSQYDQIEK